MSESWSVFYRKDKKRWILKYKDVSEWRAASAPKEIRTERDARTWAEAWLASRAAKGTAPVQRRENGPTVGDLKERWIAHRTNLRDDGKPRYKPSTLSDYASHMRTDIMPEFQDKPVQRIEVHEIRNWIRGLRSKHAAFRVNNIYSTFRSFVGDVMGEGWVTMPANPLEHPACLKELPERKAKRGPVPVFVELEHFRRVTACDDVPIQRRVRWLVAGTTGAGEGELAGRSWADAELGPKPTLRIVTSLATRGVDGWASMGDTKNVYRDRTIPLHHAAAAALRWWYSVGWAIYVGRPPRQSDPIFPNPSGGFCRPASAAQLRADLVAAGCPTRQSGNPIDAKALRASFATWLDMAGVHEEQRGRLMGHRPTTVTAKHYTAVQVETDRAAINLIAIEFMVPSLVSDVVSPTPNDKDLSSHLRDLNSRPTVYENAGAWCRARAHADIGSSESARLSTSTNGQTDTNGTRHQVVDGGDTMVEFVRLRLALGALCGMWDAFDVFELGGEA